MTSSNCKRTFIIYFLFIKIRSSLSLQNHFLFGNVHFSFESNSGNTNGVYHNNEYQHECKLLKTNDLGNIAVAVCSEKKIGIGSFKIKTNYGLEHTETDSNSESPKTYSTVYSQCKTIIVL